MNRRVLKLTCFLLMTFGFLGQSQGKTEFYISRYPAKVVPKRVLPITPDMAGEVEVVHRQEGRVEKDTLLLRINPEELQMDEAELRQQQERNSLNAENEILQLTRQKEELVFITTMPKERRMYVEQHLKTKVDERALDLLERKIKMTQEGVRLANERLQRAFDKKKKQREIVMPFDGHVQYHFPMPPEGELAMVGINSPAVTIADDSCLYVLVPMPDPAMTRLESSRLRVRVDVGGGRTMIARWSQSKVQKLERGEEGLVYYFEVPDGYRSLVWPLVGANLVARLYYEGAAGDVYVRKSDLALEAGNKAFENWNDLLRELRPGYVMVFNGETHICLRKTGEE